MRVPNASPCGLLSNFETRCNAFFHPNVLAFVLRNRLAQLARHTRGQEPLNSYLRSELWRIEAGIVSSSCHFEPPTSATLLLSLAKLRVTLPDAIKELTSNYQFHNAQPKSVALTLNAFSRNPDALSHTSREFWSKMTDTVDKLASKFNPQDVATCALATTGILATARNSGGAASPFHRSATIRLKETYRTMLIHAERILAANSADRFKIRDLSCLLLSIYSSRSRAPKVIIGALDRLKELIPASLNGIDEVLYLLDMIPPPTFTAATVEERRTKRDVARAEKAFVEWCFEYLKCYLHCLKERELGRVAAACNRLRSWTYDDFALGFAKAWVDMITDTNKISPKVLNHGICYFMRRYEASVSRELSASVVAEQQKISKVSDACARVGDMLYEHARSQYSPQELSKVEDVMSIAEQCRVKRTYKAAV